MSLPAQQDPVTLAKAKKIFFSCFAGNSFAMGRDGCEREYRSFGISEAQEEEWRSEYISLWVGKLRSEPREACWRLREAEAFEALPEMVSAAAKGDSWDRFWCALEIYELANIQREWGSVAVPTKRQVSPALIAEAIMTAVRIWQLIVKGPIVLSEEHESEITPEMLKALGASSPVMYLLNYADSMLGQAEGSGDLQWAESLSLTSGQPPLSGSE